MSDNIEYSILIVDDEQGNVDSLSRIFKREGFTVYTAFDGEQGLEEFRKHPSDIVLCDVMMPQMDGFDLLKALKTLSPHTQVLMVTAYGSIDRAKKALKEGAYDYVTKPLKRQEIVRLVYKALEKSALVQENQTLKKHIQHLQKPSLIVGQSSALRRTLEIVKQAAPTPMTVLIQGETGTGKELIARELHQRSTRSDKPLIALNCGAFPETLVDSELFGYEKGAFTGADSVKQGRFEMAAGGTLFLDEIGELPPTVQVKLLRVLEEKQIERLGGVRPIPVDLRLVAATHRDLQKEVQEGRFREDLFYRLNVIQIQVPPLRERPEDIVMLAQHFIEQAAVQSHKEPPRLAPETIEILQNYHWPGNVRQLQNAMQRSVVLSFTPVLYPSDLPPEVHKSQTEGNFFVIPFGTPLDEIERTVINETLRRTNGDKKLMAQLLGIATRTVYRKLESFQSNASKSEDVQEEKKEPSSPSLHTTQIDSKKG